ncbi:HAD-like domain-containing protein [Phakopsora pachyrhizi]|nr:HAD-like domain-containing protein [Phakopsora pachyrhizi]
MQHYTGCEVAKYFSTRHHACYHRLALELYFVQTKESLLEARAKQAKAKLKRLFSGFKICGCGLLNTFTKGTEAATSLRGFSAAKTRIFLTDFDGTLANKNVKPFKQVQKLVEDERNIIYFVTARTLGSIQGQMHGLSSERLFFAAEHGGVLKKSTEVISAQPTAFGEYTKTALQNFIDGLKDNNVIPRDAAFTSKANGEITFGFQLEGSKENWPSVQIKNPDFKNLQSANLNKLSGYKVDYMQGINFASIQPKSLNKGQFVDELLTKLKAEGSNPYVISMGNELPDESMYEAMHKHGFYNTFRVGNDIPAEQSMAKFHIANPEVALKMLEKLQSMR